MFKKTSTSYSIAGKYGMTTLTVNEEVKDHVSLHEFGEPCSGILKHWGSRKELIRELEEYIEVLREE